MGSDVLVWELELSICNKYTRKTIPTNKRNAVGTIAARRVVERELSPFILLCLILPESFQQMFIRKHISCTNNVHDMCFLLLKNQHHF